MISQFKEFISFEQLYDIGFSIIPYKKGLYTEFIKRITKKARNEFGKNNNLIKI